MSSTPLVVVMVGVGSIPKAATTQALSTVVVTDVDESLPSPLAPATLVGRFWSAL